MLWLAYAMGAECPAAATTAQALDQALATAGEAIDALNVPALQLATDELDSTLQCQGQPVSVSQAARVHRVRGIAAFVQGDETEADLWFAASRALDPTAPLGHDIGGPVAEAWERAASPSPPERIELPPPRRGVLFVDGQPIPSRPAHLPWVFQHLDGDAITTALQRPGLALPDYPGKPREKEPRARRGRPFTVAAVATGGLSLAGLAGAAWTRERYKRTDLTDEQVAPLLPANRALGVTGWSLVGVTAGLFTISIVRGEW